MADRYVCDEGERLARLIAQGFRAADGVTPINAFDFLEVVDGKLDGDVTATDDPRQMLLLVRFLQPLAAGSLDRSNVAIRGGTTIRDVRVRQALRLADLPASVEPPWSPVAHAFLSAMRTLPAQDQQSWLIVLVDRRGDHSLYTFKLVEGVQSDRAPAGFDPVLTELGFKFKIECATDFDCEVEMECPPEQTATPQLDYLARDYASFRRLMLDRLSVLQPDWQERNPADLGITLVELLAYAADRVAYFQDGVATEAYLQTARLRTSVKRHARLLDYRMHEGCNARAWVHLVVRPRLVLHPSGAPALAKGTRFLTAVAGASAVLRSRDETEALERRPEAFEALHDLAVLSHAHNEMYFHTWGESRCVLAKGATSASLRPAQPGDSLELAMGDVISFEEVRDPETGQTADADPQRRHAVRLTSVAGPYDDTLLGSRYWDITWHPEDALPLPFCLWQVTVGDVQLPITVARGNLVLVDHGATHTARELVPAEVPPQGRYRPHLPDLDLTWRVPYAHDVRRSALSALRQEPREALPAVRLVEAEGATWISVSELLGSDAFAREFVVEMEADGRSYLRFGDGVLGRRPPSAANLKATYRTGRGVAGNVGAGAILHLVSDQLSGAVIEVRNPMPAAGGVDPEPVQTVQLEAPAAFKVQMRAVTAGDWANVAIKHPAVQRAVANVRWTGSWNTVFLTVDPIGGRALDADLASNLLTFLEQFRMAGLDLELRPPAYVPIDLAFVICVSPEHYAHEVKAAVLDRLSSGVRRNGTQGWFHPDRLTFGQDVYLSPLIADVMQIPGVAWVDLDPATNGSDAVRFQRLGRKPAGELEDGVLKVARLEVARLDNDPSAPDNGRLRLTLRGGR